VRVDRSLSRRSSEAQISMTEAFYCSSLRVTKIVDLPNSCRIGFVDTGTITLSDPRVFR
jgi:hypothetical protein